MRLLYYINLFLFSISMISTIYTRYAVLRRLKIKHCDLFFLLFLKKRAIIVFERKKRKVVMTMSIFRSKIGYWRGLLIIINHKRGNISFYEKPDILILQLGRCAVVRCVGGRVWVGICWRRQSLLSIAHRSGCKGSKNTGLVPSAWLTVLGLVPIANYFLFRFSTYVYSTNIVLIDVTDRGYVYKLFYFV